MYLCSLSVQARQEQATETFSAISNAIMTLWVSRHLTSKKLGRPSDLLSALSIYPWSYCAMLLHTENLVKNTKGSTNSWAARLCSCAQCDPLDRALISCDRKDSGLKPLTGLKLPWVILVVLVPKEPSLPYRIRSLHLQIQNRTWPLVPSFAVPLSPAPGM